MKKIEPEKLKEIREGKKLDQKEFGELLGVSETYISNLETGKKPINYKFMDRLISAGLYTPPVTAIPDGENLTIIIDELKKLSPEDTEGIKRLCCNLLNITPSEFDELKTVISSDKPKIFVYLQALTGDPSAKKMIRQLLDND